MGCEPPVAFQYSMNLSIARSIRACFISSRGKSDLRVRVLVKVVVPLPKSVIIRTLRTQEQTLSQLRRRKNDEDIRGLRGA
jgi:hypothetical protein